MSLLNMILICLSLCITCGAAELTQTERDNFRVGLGAQQFTTESYSKAALRVFLGEANNLAQALRLKERIPIESSYLVEAQMSSRFWSDQEGLFGTISTTNYTYVARAGNQLCEIDCRFDNTERYFNSLVARYGASEDQMPTNSAYNLARGWLLDAGVDVGTLERECRVVFHVMHRGRQCIPVIWVMWRQAAADFISPTLSHDDGFQTPAAVWLIEPERRLLQLAVGNPRYIRRKPMSVPDADQLLQQTTNSEMRKLQFTTLVYRKAALDVLLQEANLVSRQLGLPTALPIESSMLKKVTVATPVASDRFGWFGTIRTDQYCFSAAASNKLSWVERDRSYLSYFDERSYLASLKAKYTWPKALLATNSAYAMATQWLSAIAADVGGLNRDFQVHTKAWEFGGNFVPLYDVKWQRSDGGQTITAAEVTIVEPEHLLKKLVVYDPVYLNRKLLSVADRSKLLSEANSPAH